MFENFTARASKVIAEAKSEAKRVGDDCVGSQNILFGLVREGSGVAHHILDINGVTAKMIRDEAEKVVQRGSGVEENPKFTPRTRAIFEYAVEEATALGHNYVGTEHILLGLLREKECVGVQILTNFGINLEQLRKDVLNLLGFYDRNFSIKPTDEKNIFSVMYIDSKSNECVGRYESTTEELLLNRPFTILEIHRLLEKIREFHRDQKRV